MYDKMQFNNLMADLQKTGQLLQPESNLKYMLGYYRVGPEEAIRNHINNMIETYGEEAVIKIIREKIENGDFCVDKTDKPA